MQRSSLKLYLAVWIASIAIAFFIGRSLSFSGSSSPDLRAPTTLEAQQLERSSGSLNQTASSQEPANVAENELQPLQQPNREQTLQMLTAAFELPQSDPSRSSTIRNLLKQLANTDPLAALELTDSISSLRDAERARTDILKVWANREPMAALAWADTHLADVPSNLRSSQMRAIMQGFAESNPKAAFSYANGLSEATPADMRYKNRLLGAVIETQIQSGGLADVQTTIALLPDGPTKEHLQRELVDEWAAFDPDAAAAYVQSLGDAANTQLKTTLISEWAENDPAAAAAWLSTLSTEDPAYGRATTEITREWTRYDLTASSEWLNSLPASPELDRAVATYTYRAAQEDPPTAMSWAESISNDRMRSKMMEQVAANWKTEDPQSFTNYLDKSDLSEKEREQLESAKSWHTPGGGNWGRRR
ncbi:MAG: hypothetical protein P8M62_05245 [Opitutae bacterium]|jgi:hypothetical protein|nr:hypothetical protein [Opitutae bacterium]MDG2345445.1 hypothetical protein [Opitutae bacterium]